MQFSSGIDRAGFYLLTTCVVLAPAYFGSSSASSAALVGMVLAICLLGCAAVPIKNERAGGLFCGTAVLSSVIVVGALLQALPWDIPSTTQTTWSTTGQLIDNVFSPSAASRYQALHSVGYVLIPLVGFMCALVYISDDRRYMWFIQIVLTANVVITVLCIGQYVISPRSLLWTSKHHYLDAFTGTFVNPNTAATHFGFLLLLALSLSLRQLEVINPYRLLFSKRLARAQLKDARLLSAYALATFVFVIALLLTRSRAGILSSFAGVVPFVAVFAFLAARRQLSVARALGVSALAIFGAGCVLAVFGERFLLRVQDQGLLESGRLCTYESTWNAIKNGSWFGTGLGTFQDVFPAYRSPACGLYGHWEMAHSVFLEGWLTLGIAFLACVVLVYYQLIKAYGRGVLARRRYQFVPLCCFSLLLTLTLHSLVDFSLQISGFALAAAVILGAGAAVALGDLTKRSGSRPF